jgi:hypothetical protein
MTESRYTDPEDEAFNEIERRSVAKKEAVRATIDMKEELTKLLTESYDAGVKDALESVVQVIKELRPAIMPLEGMGRGKATQEWFDILVKHINEIQEKTHDTR